MASSDVDNTNGRFTYDALPDASTYIRLIEIHHADRDDGEIEIGISNWPLTEVPKYQAVSYTWGEATTTVPISIRGCPGTLDVRQNCADVLRQAYCFKPESSAYFWVDAICINQEDNVEKNSQVAMMGDIFENAECVLACVGMHDESSEFLLEALISFETVLEAGGASLLPVLIRDEGEDSEQEVSTGEHSAEEDFAGKHSQQNDFASEGSEEDEAEMVLSPEDRCIGLCALWFSRISDEDALRFMKACDELPQRSYFWRIWILQELYLARNIRIICGFDELSLTSLLFWWRQSKLLFHNLFKQKLPQEYLQQAPWTDPEYFLDQGGSGLGNVFEDILLNSIRPQPRGRMQMYQEGVTELCEPRHCQDPRDIIYGTLRLHDWNEIKPDYTKATYELAMETMAQFGSRRELLQFVGRLGIRRDDPRVSGPISQRLGSADCTEALDETSISELPDSIHYAAGGFQLTSHSSWVIARAHRGPMRFLSEEELPDQLSAFILFFNPEDLVIHLVQDEGQSNKFESLDDEDMSLVASLGVRVCKERLSSWAWRPEQECFFTMYGFLEMKEDVILPTLEMLYTHSLILKGK
ncbi:hypothetical protein E8E14_013317 [Neopestalotiopsis sp. 37M]|nr:hypothetical protein E8E14_013317 [Neopestalotiopsis sp. 37M]